MKTRWMSLAAAAAVLTACGGQSTPAAESSAPVSTATATATSGAAATTTGAAASSTTTGAATPAAGETPDRDFVVGKWGTDGDCVLAIDLRADGTSDGPFGNWAYTDGVITFADAPELKISVTVIDEDTMESTNERGKSTTMTRCP